MKSVKGWCEAGIRVLNIYTLQIVFPRTVWEVGDEVEDQVDNIMDDKVGGKLSDEEEKGRGGGGGGGGS